MERPSPLFTLGADLSLEFATLPTARTSADSPACATPDARQDGTRACASENPSPTECVPLANCTGSTSHGHLASRNPGLIRCLRADVVSQDQSLFHVKHGRARETGPDTRSPCPHCGDEIARASTHTPGQPLSTSGPRWGFGPAPAPDPRPLPRPAPPNPEVRQQCSTIRPQVSRISMREEEEGSALFGSPGYDTSGPPSIWVARSKHPFRRTE